MLHRDARNTHPAAVNFHKRRDADSQYAHGKP
jgi:hypothetical protein